MLVYKAAIKMLMRVSHLGLDSRKYYIQFIYFS